MAPKAVDFNLNSLESRLGQMPDIAPYYVLSFETVVQGTDVGLSDPGVNGCDTTDERR